MRLLTSCFLVLSFVIAGCGKPDGQKAMEEQLNAQVIEAHRRLMQEMSELQDLTEGIDIELVNHDRLAAAHPVEFRGRTPDDLISAKKMLMAANASMEAWMSSFVAYDPSMKHDLAMAKLTRDREDLAGLRKSFDAARKASEGALEAHRKMADQFSTPKIRRSPKR